MIPCYTFPMSDLSTFAKLRLVLHKAGMKPVYFLPPVLLTCIAVTCEGISIALLVPIVNTFIAAGGPVSLENIPVIHYIADWIPASVTASRSVFLAWMVGVFVVAVLLKNLFRYVSVISMSYLAYRTAHHLRKQLFNRYLRFGKQYFDQTTIGHHSTVLSTFTELTMNPVIGADRYFSTLLSVIAYLIIMCGISWKLTLLALPLFFILHFSVRQIIRRIQRVSRDISETAKVLGKQTVEILSTIPLVIAYNSQHVEREKYKDISSGYANLWARNIRLAQLINPINEIETLIAILILLGSMGFFLANAHIPASAFVVYFYLVLNAANKFGVLTGFRAQIANVGGPVNEILDIFHDENKYIIPSGEREFAGLRQSIDFRHLNFGYTAQRQVLEDISFSIQKGAMTAIVGPTGSGKSTIVGLLMRYYDCDPSMIFVDNIDIRDYSLTSIRSHIAIVSQDTLLLNDTIGANICYGLNNVSDKRMKDVLRQARLERFIADLPQGLDTQVGDRGVQLSGGEKQRVSIARALLKGADILILDEATSALDSQTELLIQEAIDEAIKGRTAIVIAHRLSTIKNADTIVVLENGKCIEQGSLNDLLATKGAFYAAWQAQQFR